MLGRGPSGLRSSLLGLAPVLCLVIASSGGFCYGGVQYRGRGRCMASRQAWGIGIGAAIGAVLGAVLFDYLALGPGALGAGIRAALGALIGGVLVRG